jgi:hypothetical protein
MPRALPTLPVTFGPIASYNINLLGALDPGHAVQGCYDLHIYWDYWSWCGSNYSYTCGCSHILDPFTLAVRP